MCSSLCVFPLHVLFFLSFMSPLSISIKRWQRSYSSTSFCITIIKLKRNWSGNDCYEETRFTCQSSLHPSIWYSCFIVFRVVAGGWSLSELASGETKGTPRRGCQPIKKATQWLMITPMILWGSWSTEWKSTQTQWENKKHPMERLSRDLNQKLPACEVSSSRSASHMTAMGGQLHARLKPSVPLSIWGQFSYRRQIWEVTEANPIFTGSYQPLRTKASKMFVRPTDAFADSSRDCRERSLWRASTNL